MSQFQKIAIDIGYGDTKVCVENKDGSLNVFKFPSAVAKVKEAQSDFGNDAMPDSYLFNGKRYFVGEKAQYNAVSTRGYGFLSNYGPLIAYHAIMKAGLDVKKPIHIVTGLSIMNWGEADSFHAIMSKFSVDNVSLEPVVDLMAQGQGVLFDFEGEKDGMVCVVDIGYNTFDFMVFEDWVPRKDLSYADPIGANKIITDLQAIVKREFNAPISELEAKDIFVRGNVVNFGNEIDFTDKINELKEDYNIFIMDELRTKSLEVLRKAKTVILSGGGAYFLEGTDLPDNVQFSETPYEFGNVRGYFKS
ncbi:ParM/StbA family protein [Sulfuricurvum sp. IAE1]|uniref:ParM/StbA family protein n=1 Tax=Sulfuricurvum sp. IAE1 TaxID=2546102 RepID=UPI00104387A7|nr:ParM/StbA family protein [Sulfuricurvum sp. IAE1]TDA63647.1 ParM/StbA family protein [Sulfuricurvum sp. IAE1]